MKRANARTLISFASFAAIGLVSAPAAASPTMTGPVLRPAAVGPAITAVARRSVARTFRVYATREGLVGQSTANGHTIVRSDHFVSLPSTMSLSRRDGDHYSVRVCARATRRCAYEPVWDVGPWNTHDAYWNVTRTSWTKLPVGRPEAQAAYQDGFNGGQDQFGRDVRNPAGIDLADGTIRDGLEMRSNGWVDVTFLWTGGGARGAIATNGGTVNVRTGAGTSHRIVGLAGPHAQIPITCKIKGESIRGTSTWYRMAAGNYITAAYVDVAAGSAIARC
jgi:hypothetical protein